MKPSLFVLLVTLTFTSALTPASVSAGEAEVDRIDENCLTIRRLPEPVCTCFSEMASTDLDDQEQTLLAAWIANDHREAARLLDGDVTLDQAMRVSRFASAQLPFCAQYS